MAVVSGAGTYKFSAYALSAANYWIQILATIYTVLRKSGSFIVTPLNVWVWVKGQRIRLYPSASSESRRLMLAISSTKRRRTPCSRSRISSSDQWKW